MDNNINNLNTYIELIKYTLNKVKNNETDHISENVIKSVNKNIDDIKKLYSNNNKEDSDNESTKNNDTESISSNDIDFIDPEPNIVEEDSDEEPSMIYYKIYPEQINKLEKFADSIYLY